MSTPPPPPAPSPSSGPRPRRRLVPWILGCGGAVVGCAGCASLIAVLMLGGGSVLLGFGLGAFVDQVATELDTLPRLHEEIGRLQELELDVIQTMGEPGDEVFVFRAVGSHGIGRITARCVTVDADTEDVVWARLELPDGRIVELVPAAESP